MLGFTLILSLTTAILFGLVPAARSSRIDLFPELKATEPYARVRRVRWRHLLVVLQVTGLLLASGRGRTFHSVGQKPPRPGPGIRPGERRNIVRRAGTAGVRFGQRHPLRKSAPAEYGDSTWSRVCNAGTTCSRRFRLRYVPHEKEQWRKHSGRNQFRWAPVLRDAQNSADPGPRLSMDGRQDSQAVTIINQAAARTYWPDTDPIGERISFRRRSWEVIGVAPEIQYHHPGGDSHPYVYLPLLQQYEANFTLMARGRQPTGSTVSSMRRAVRELDADLPTFGPPSLTDTLALPMAATRFLNFLLSAFGFLALTLASVGLYGVLSRSVVRRTREIAVRLAMGARRRHTVWLILKRALILVGYRTLHWSCRGIGSHSATGGYTAPSSPGRSGNVPGLPQWWSWQHPCWLAGSPPTESPGWNPWKRYAMSDCVRV